MMRLNRSRRSSARDGQSHGSLILQPRRWVLLTLLFQLDGNAHYLVRKKNAQFVSYTRPHKQTNPPNKKPMFAPIQKPNVIAARGSH
jgi:hypothetical protein